MTNNNPILNLTLDRSQLNTLISELREQNLRLAELQRQTTEAVTEAFHLNQRLRLLLLRADPLDPIQPSNQKGGN